MAKQTVESLVSGGQATAAPPLGPMLGPMGVNIGKVVAEINKKTESFKGMQVPVKIIVDDSTKEFEITVGTPPASALIKKEAHLEKGSGNPLKDKVADVRIEQIIKIAKMKETNLLGKTLKERVKEIIGTCNSMGVLVQGVPAVDAIQLVNQGRFEKEIKAEKTELTAEELKALEHERKRLEEEILARKTMYENKAKEILATFAGKEKSEIKAKMREAGLPEGIIKQFLAEAAAAPAAGAEGAAATPAAGAKPEATAAAKAPAKEEKKK